MKILSSTTASVILLLAAFAPEVSAQDYIAHRASVDNSMKDVSSVKITRSAAVNLNDPANHIYTNWDNGGVNRVTGYAPSNLKIDLRGFAMPTPSRVITSKFGPRWHRQHQGLDIKVYIGDTIRAAFDGKVRVVRYDRNGYGNYVVIRHPNGLETLYGHMSKHLVVDDQIVRAGEPIGLGGNTGRSTGSHLHFETRLVGKAIDPALMFDFVNQDVTGDFYVTDIGAVVKDGMSSSPSSYGEIPNGQESGGNSVESSQARILANAKPVSQHSAPVPAAAKKDTKSVSKVPPQKTYRIKTGDTLYSIARNNGLTLNELLRINKMTIHSTIKEGMVIKTS